GNLIDEYNIGKGFVGNDGLVLYLPFDGDMKDKSGNGNNGTCTGNSCPSTSAGKIGNSFSFDGVDDFIQVNYNSFPGLDGTKETLLMWVKPRGSSILLQNAAWSRRLYYDNSNKFSFYFYDSSPTPILTSVLDDTAYSRDQWHQVGYTFSSNTVKMYVDGKQTKTVILANSLYNPNSYWHFGHLCAGAICNYYYTGELDEVKIYNRSLSPEEVYYLYKYN
ncbi:MAG: LamG domain-containing protein, partial [Nanoarchaeota archaeon]